MAETKYQIFISSTFRDLVDARRGIIDVVLQMNHFPMGMEMFSAADDDQWTVIKRAIDLSDYYVVVLGHRYGSLTSEGISYTEKEYEYAKESGVPIVTFIRRDDVPLLPTETEAEPNKAEKMKQFRDKASHAKVVEWWTDVPDLRTKVAVSLHKLFQSSPRPGWVRADDVQSSTDTVEQRESILSIVNSQIPSPLTTRFATDFLNFSNGFFFKSHITLRLKSVNRFDQFETPQKQQILSLANDLYEWHRGEGPSTKPIRNITDQYVMYLVTDSGEHQFQLWGRTDGDISVQLTLPVQDDSLYLVALIKVYTKITKTVIDFMTKFIGGDIVAMGLKVGPFPPNGIKTDGIFSCDEPDQHSTNNGHYDVLEERDGVDPNALLRQFLIGYFGKNGYLGFEEPLRDVDFSVFA